MSIKRVPTAVGLLTCDQIIVAEKTQNVTPVNCFGVRRVHSFPAPLPFSVFSLISGGAGEILMEVTIQRLDTLAELYRKTTRIEFADPLIPLGFCLNIINCRFPVPGYYQATLFADDDIIAGRRFAVVLKGNEQ